MSDDKATTKVRKARKPRDPNKKRQLVLVEVTEDVTTKQPCFAVIPLPPGAEKATAPAAIAAACRRAVYEDGQKQYGNRNLAVVSVLSTFDVQFVERMALTPPT